LGPGELVGEHSGVDRLSGKANEKNLNFWREIWKFLARNFENCGGRIFFGGKFKIKLRNTSNSP
jgi:hypothetical protein